MDSVSGSFWVLGAGLQVLADGVGFSQGGDDLHATVAAPSSPLKSPVTPHHGRGASCPRKRAVQCQKGDVASSTRTAITSPITNDSISVPCPSRSAAMSWRRRASPLFLLPLGFSSIRPSSS